MKKLLALLLLISSFAFGGTVTGTITTATSGPVINGTLTLTPTQAFIVSGTATVVSSPVACYTDAFGNVVGEPNPLVAPVVTPNTGSGTLASGTYFTRFAYQDASGTSFYSPETTTVLSSAGSLIVTAPVKQPATATGYKVFISASSSTETLQGTITGTPGTWASYTQSVPLVSGAALPSTNTTACKLFFNDEGFAPAGYMVSLTNSSGSTVAGFPQRWRLMGGSAGTVNVSNGVPLWDGFVQYPIPILSSPAFNANQFINSALSLNGFPLSATNFFNAGFEKFTEIAAPVCGAGFDFIWGDSTAHRLKECDNNGAAVNVSHDTGLTVGQVPKANASGVLVPSAITDDGVKISSTEPYAEVEAAAPSGVASSDLIYADSTAHRWKANNNNGGAKTIANTDGDTFTNTTLTSPVIGGTPTGNISTFSMLQGSCLGTASAGTTLGLNFGPCTSAVGINLVIGSSATIKNLFCAANVGGVNGSSGVVSVSKNGSAQTLTCTFGTATACSDTTHSFSVASGDKLVFNFTTQAAETLATVSCTIQVQ